MTIRLGVPSSELTNQIIGQEGPDVVLGIRHVSPVVVEQCRLERGAARYRAHPRAENGPGRGDSWAVEP